MMLFTTTEAAGYTKDQVVALGEYMDTNREVSFYDKANARKAFYVRDTVVYCIGMLIALASLCFPQPFVSFSWESAVNMQLALISTGLTVYALAFTFVDQVFYGINVIDYSLTLRLGTVSPKTNALISICCFVLTFACAWTSCGRVLFFLTDICATAMLDLLLSLIGLYSGTGNLHGEIRTFALQEVIGNARNRADQAHTYLLDLFEDASRNYLQGNDSMLEDDLYAIRCMYGVLSKDVAELDDDTVNLLIALNKSTSQLAKNLSRHGDYRHALIIIRRCMTRILANDSSAIAKQSDMRMRRIVSAFDLSATILSVFASLDHVNILAEGLYDLIRDILFAYGMASELVGDSSSQAFSRKTFEQMGNNIHDSILQNITMNDDEKSVCLERIFHLSHIDLKNYIRMDGQNRNRYYCDLSSFDMQRNESDSD